MLTALRSRDFRLLWLGQSISVIGDALVIVAIGLYVTRITGSAGDVSFVLAAYAAPLVVFLLVGGVVAERLPRQLVIIVSSLVRAALHGLLALLIATGTVRIWHMIVMACCTAARRRSSVRRTRRWCRRRSPPTTTSRARRHWVG